MRTPLNKAISMPKNKTNELAESRESAKKNEKLEAVADIVAAIRKSSPEKRDQILKEISDSKAAQSAAIQAKEAAETGADFDKACDEERRAHDREIFLQRRLEQIDSTPNMNEIEYYSAVGAVNEEVKAAAEKFRGVAENAISAIVAAKNEYLEVTTRANEILIALDNASDVLQKKYRYREVKYIGQEPDLKRDPNEWKRHAIRYDTEKAFEIAANDGDKFNISVYPAWNAAENWRAAAGAEEAKKKDIENKKKREEQRHAETKSSRGKEPDYVPRRPPIYEEIGEPIFIL